MSSTLENLKVAKGLLVEFGVGMGTMYQQGRYCSVGAVVAARTGRRGALIFGENSINAAYVEGWPELKALHSVIPEDLRREQFSVTDIIDFNDDNPEQVLEMFDTAISNLEAE